MDSRIRATFEALFALEEIREIWRQTAPFHRLSESEQKRLSRLVEKVRTCLDIITSPPKEVEPPDIAPKIPLRSVEEEFVNISPIQRGGTVPPIGRKAMISYIDGYSVCDFCMPPFRLDKIKKPDLAEFHEELAEFLGMDVARLIPGARRGFQAVVSSLVKAGDPVVVDSLSHYTVYLSIEQAGGRVFEAKSTGFPEYRLDPSAYEDAIKRAERETGKKPALAVLSHVDYSVGNLHDAKRIAETVHEHDIPLLLNCAYTVGVMPVNGRDLGVDIIVSSGHKSFASPAPSGILATTAEMAKRILRTSAIVGDMSGKMFPAKEVELLGCTLMGGVSVVMMAVFPHIKERVGKWEEEVKKARWFSREMERIEGVVQLGMRPKEHTLIKFKTDSFHEVAKKHKKRGFFLYRELKKRKVFGVAPGVTETLKVNVYGLSWEQLRYVVECFHAIASKYKIPVA